MKAHHHHEGLIWFGFLGFQAGDRLFGNFSILIVIILHISRLRCRPFFSFHQRTIVLDRIRLPFRIPTFNRPRFIVF